MPMTTATLDEITDLLGEIQARVNQVAARVAEAKGDGTPTPVLNARDLARVEAVGEVAHRHLLHIETHGTMTLGDSLEIRRELYGDKVRSTANLFGTKESGALFHRTTEYGTPRSNDQEVKLTAEGERIARLWRELHGLSA